MLVLLVALTAGAPVSLQIFLPALPALQAHFAVSTGVAQYALTFSILANAFATLAYGPLSDRFGRRPVLLWGLAAFFAGSTLAVFAADITTLVIARILQAGGAAAGMVLARAIIRDLYDIEQAARALGLPHHGHGGGADDLADHRRGAGRRHRLAGSVRRAGPVRAGPVRLDPRPPRGDPSGAGPRARRRRAAAGRDQAVPRAVVPRVQPAEHVRHRHLLRVSRWGAVFHGRHSRPYRDRVRAVLHHGVGLVHVRQLSHCAPWCAVSASTAWC
ncbi:MAG: MFS transporter [Gammaproteobacteria bacterium]|nr:MFS transporter [Gammaproteobacteria bacterium]